MKTYLILLVAILMTLLSSCDRSANQTTRYLNDFVATTCQPVMDSFFVADAKGMMAVGVFLSTPDEVLFDEMYYFSNDDNPLPDGNTLFMLGSVTKTFTTAMLAQQVVAGNIDLYAPAQNYYPPLDQEAIPGPILPNQFNGAPVTITMTHLASHTSGLEKSLPKVPSSILPANMEGFTKGRIPYLSGYDSLKLQSLLFAPGDSSSYSNTGIALIGVALSYLATPDNPLYYNNYNSILHYRLLDPIGMRNTTLLPDFGAFNNAAIPYDDDSNLANYGASTLPFNLASGGLYSTLSDMMLFGKEMVGMGHVLTQQERDTIFAVRYNNSSNVSTVLGWTQYRNLRDTLGTRHPRYEKSGELAGFRSYINVATPQWHSEDKKLFVIALVNHGSDDMPLNKITREIMDKMLELDLQRRQP